MTRFHVYRDNGKQISASAGTITNIDKGADSTSFHVHWPKGVEEHCAGVSEVLRTAQTSDRMIEFVADIGQFEWTRIVLT